MKKGLRGVAVITLVCFLTTQSVWGAPGVGIEIAPQHEMPTALSIDVPAELGTVDALYEAPGAAHPQFILHIQNAHANYQAQMKIKQLLEHMNKKYGFQTIFIEGAAEKLNPDYLKLFPDQKENEEFCDSLAKQGELTGAELFLMEESGTGKGSSVEGLGIEQTALYRSNYDALKKVFGAETDVSRFFSGFDSKLDRVASKTFTPETRQLIADWKRFEQGRREFMPFVRDLAKKSKKVLNVDLESLFAQVNWPQISRLLVIQQMERDLDKTKGLEEKKMLVERLRSQPISKELLAALENFNEGSISIGKSSQEVLPRQLMENLSAEAGPQGFKFSDYPAFSLFAGYVILRSELDPKALFEEIEYLFTRVLDTLAPEPQQKTLLALYRDGELLRKLLRLELSRTQWRTLMTRKDQVTVAVLVGRLRDAVLASGDTSTQKGQEVMPPAFKEKMSGLFSAGLEFYDFARRREGAFYKEIQTAMAERKITKAVLITGGFHTDGMSDIFRENAISYGIVTPRLSEKSNEKMYRGIMMGKHPGDFDVSYLEAVVAMQSPQVQFDQQGFADISAILDEFMKTIKTMDRAKAVEVFKTTQAYQALRAGDAQRGIPGFDVVQKKTEDGKPAVDELGRPLFGLEKLTSMPEGQAAPSVTPTVTPAKRAESRLGDLMAQRGITPEKWNAAKKMTVWDPDDPDAYVIVIEDDPAQQLILKARLGGFYGKGKDGTSRIVFFKTVEDAVEEIGKRLNGESPAQPYRIISYQSLASDIKGSELVTELFLSGYDVPVIMQTSEANAVARDLKTVLGDVPVEKLSVYDKDRFNQQLKERDPDTLVYLGVPSIGTSGDTSLLRSESRGLLGLLQPGSFMDSSAAPVALAVAGGAVGFLVGNLVGMMFPDMNRKAGVTGTSTAVGAVGGFVTPSIVRGFSGASFSWSYLNPFSIFSGVPFDGFLLFATSVGVALAGVWGALTVWERYHPESYTRALETARMIPAKIAGLFRGRINNQAAAENLRNKGTAKFDLKGADLFVSALGVPFRVSLQGDLVALEMGKGQRLGDMFVPAGLKVLPQMPQVGGVVYVVRTARGIEFARQPQENMAALLKLETPSYDPRKPRSTIALTRMQSNDPGFSVEIRRSESRLMEEIEQRLTESLMAADNLGPRELVTSEHWSKAYGFSRVDAVIAARFVQNALADAKGVLGGSSFDELSNSQIKQEILKRLGLLQGVDVERPVAPERSLPGFLSRIFGARSESRDVSQDSFIQYELALASLLADRSPLMPSEGMKQDMVSFVVANPDFRRMVRREVSKIQAMAAGERWGDPSLARNLLDALARSESRVLETREELQSLADDLQAQFNELISATPEARDRVKFAVLRDGVLATGVSALFLTDPANGGYTPVHLKNVIGARFSGNRNMYVVHLEKGKQKISRIQSSLIIQQGRSQLFSVRDIDPEQLALEAPDVFVWFGKMSPQQAARSASRAESVSLGQKVLKGVAAPWRAIGQFLVSWWAEGMMDRYYRLSSAAGLTPSQIERAEADNNRFVKSFSSSSFLVDLTLQNPELMGNVLEKRLQSGDLSNTLFTMRMLEDRILGDRAKNGRERAKLLQVWNQVLPSLARLYRRGNHSEARATQLWRTMDDGYRFNPDSPSARAAVAIVGENFFRSESRTADDVKRLKLRRGTELSASKEERARPVIEAPVTAMPMEKPRASVADRQAEAAKALADAKLDPKVTHVLESTATAAFEKMTVDLEAKEAFLKASPEMKVVMALTWGLASAENLAASIGLLGRIAGLVSSGTAEGLLERVRAAAPNAVIDVSSEKCVVATVITEIGDASDFARGLKLVLLFNPNARLLFLNAGDAAERQKADQVKAIISAWGKGINNEKIADQIRFDFSPMADAINKKAIAAFVAKARNAGEKGETGFVFAFDGAFLLKLNLDMVSGTPVALAYTKNKKNDVAARILLTRTAQLLRSADSQTLTEELWKLGIGKNGGVFSVNDQTLSSALANLSQIMAAFESIDKAA